MAESADSENAAILQLVQLVLLDAIKKGASRIALGTEPATFSTWQRLHRDRASLRPEAEFTSR
jgi:hypothetical protein